MERKRRMKMKTRIDGCFLFYPGDMCLGVWFGWDEIAGP